MKIEYGLSVPLGALGFDAGKDKIVFNVQSELNMYTDDAADAMKIWGWDPAALRPEDHYRIDQLLRMYVFQRDQVISALDRVNDQLYDYASDEEIKQELEDFKGLLVEKTAELRKEARKHLSTPGSIASFSEYGEWEAHLRGTGFPATAGVIAFQHPSVARYLGPIPSLAMGGYSGEGVYFRLTERSYPRDWIEDGRLYDLVDMALALQAELQLQCLLTDREFTRVIEPRGQQFAYLKAEAARRAAAEQGSSFWADFGDILGIVSAVAGVLALVPVLTPIMGPVAAVTAIASLGAHTVDAAIKGDWDAGTIVGLGADALAALPGVGAVAKSLRSCKAVVKTIGSGAKASYKASVVTRRAGLAFLAETGGVGASDATKVFNYIGTKGAKVVGASERAGKLTGKVLQGSVNLATQIPLVVEMSTGTDMGEEKNVAGGAALTANYGQTIGSWGAVGTAAQRTATVSLATFGRIIGRH
ncbi:hypothetical protein PO587_43535 [Streptomyces gilvifuscus]|uniref:Uncharacterized protein n=1 Tax=Streptomyces gilvifuscus TaxID=1550617 RepID=A0ABT5G959_9ACTN|nr:hypothetical protein [Streptomyces gilvifuscus]MDC2961319.1 hypothetical protein [Streptomyces gilvifuscus]